MLVYELFKSLRIDLKDKYVSEEMVALHIVLFPILVPIAFLLDLMILPFELSLLIVKLYRKKVNK